MHVDRHPLQIVPVALLACLSAWHLASFLSAEPMGGLAVHALLTSLALVMALASLFFRGADGEFTRYLESLISPLRPQLAGAACFLLGGLHFLTVKEPVFLSFGFLVLLLGFFESAGLANRFLPAITGDTPKVTADTLRRLLLNQAGMLATAFVLSVVLLYVSLMAVAGFTDTWTVVLLAALMLLALAFMVMVRKL